LRVIHGRDARAISQYTLPTYHVDLLRTKGRPEDGLLTLFHSRLAAARCRQTRN